MSSRRTTFALVAMAGLVASHWLERGHPSLAAGTRVAALSYVFGFFVLRVRAVYLRRRPHWTPESWRRYLLACAIPLGALAAMVGMMSAIDLKLPVVGAAHSTARGIWAFGVLAFLAVGAIGLETVVDWLERGDPARQFAVPGWLRRG